VEGYFTDKSKKGAIKKMLKAKMEKNTSRQFCIGSEAL